MDQNQSKEVGFLSLGIEVRKVEVVGGAIHEK